MPQGASKQMIKSQAAALSNELLLVYGGVILDSAVPGTRTYLGT